MLRPTGFLTEPRQIPNLRYEKALFARKLSELGLTSEFSQRVMNKLGESFGLEELRANLEAEVNQFRLKEFHLSDGMVYHDQNVAQGIWMLARSNYEVQFQPDQQLSERIIFPATPSQRNGVEARAPRAVVVLEHQLIWSSLEERVEHARHLFFGCSFVHGL